MFNPGADDLLSDLRYSPLQTLLVKIPLVVAGEEALLRALPFWAFPAPGDLRPCVLAVCLDIAAHQVVNVRCACWATWGGLAYFVWHVVVAVVLTAAFARWGIGGSYAAHLAWDWLLMGGFVVYWLRWKDGYEKRRAREGVRMVHGIDGAVALPYDYVPPTKACERCKGVGSVHEMVFALELGSRTVEQSTFYLCRPCWLEARPALLRPSGGAA